MTALDLDAIRKLKDKIAHDSENQFGASSLDTNKLCALLEAEIARLSHELTEAKATLAKIATFKFDRDPFRQIAYMKELASRNPADGESK